MELQWVAGKPFSCPGLRGDIGKGDYSADGFRVGELHFVGLENHDLLEWSPEREGIVGFPLGTLFCSSFIEILMMLERECIGGVLPEAVVGGAACNFKEVRF